MGVDTSSTTTYSVKGSSITFQESTYSANFGGSQHSDTGSCSEMTERLGGIVLACSNGDTLYSPTNTPQANNRQI
jgi:hypothetical protein